MPWNKTDRAFKTLINKRTTDSTGKNFYNEKGDFTINVHSDEIWNETIPGTPPGSDTAVVKVYSLLTLIEDLSVPSQQAWFASSNSSTVSAQSDETSRLKDWISDKYNNGGNYQIHLYDKDSVEIPVSDASGWFFDYQTGILTFSAANTDSGSVAARAPFKVTGYRYIGGKGATAGTAGTGTENTLPIWEAGGTTLGDSIVTQPDTGTIVIDGTLQAFSKSFNIKHPTKVQMRLVYGTLEGPEFGVYQRGTVKSRGNIRVILPEYWYKLVGLDYNVFITARGNYHLYVVNKDENGFEVQRTGILSRWKETEFDFFVVGARIDAPLEVEQKERK